MWYFVNSSLHELNNCTFTGRCVAYYLCVFVRNRTKLIENLPDKARQEILTHHRTPSMLQNVHGNVNGEYMAMAVGMTNLQSYESQCHKIYAQLVRMLLRKLRGDACTHIFIHWRFVDIKPAKFASLTYMYVNSRFHRIFTPICHHISSQINFLRSQEMTKNRLFSRLWKIWPQASLMLPEQM